VASVRKLEGFDHGHVAVLACKDDRSLTGAVRRSEAQLKDPRSLLRVGNFQKLIAEADKIPALAEWSAAFRKRYLDLSAGGGVLVQTGGLNIQFDAGRATAMRLAAVDVRAIALDAVFLTHHHSDHLQGLDDLVFSSWIAGTQLSGPEMDTRL